MQLLNSGVLIFIHLADMCIFVMMCVAELSISTDGRRLLCSEKSATFSPKFKKVKKDSLKLSSKIRLIVKSLHWICIYFLPQFQNNYQKIGPSCTFAMHYDRKQSQLVGYGTQLIWGSHDKLTQLGQDLDNLEVLELLHTLYCTITSLFLLLHCCTQCVIKFHIYRCTAPQLFLDKVTST